MAIDEFDLDVQFSEELENENSLPSLSASDESWCGTCGTCEGTCYDTCGGTGRPCDC